MGNYRPQLEQEDMIDIVFAGPIPNHIRNKAFFVLDHHTAQKGWRKIHSLGRYFSFRLNRNYRIIRTADGNFIVCNHDLYEKKIKTIKRKGIK